MRAAGVIPKSVADPTWIATSRLPDPSPAGCQQMTTQKLGRGIICHVDGGSRWRNSRREFKTDNSDIENLERRWRTWSSPRACDRRRLISRSSGTGVPRQLTSWISSSVCHECWTAFYGGRLWKDPRGSSSTPFSSRMIRRDRQRVNDAVGLLVRAEADVEEEAASRGGTIEWVSPSSSSSSSSSGSGLDFDDTAVGIPIPRRLTMQVGGRDLVLETGRIGRQANGAVTLTDGDTVLYTTVCASDEEGVVSDFVPLTVNYQERLSAVGRTSGGFIKREGRPREREVLTCRLIDRPLRPLMPKGFHYETQVLSWVLSYDGIHSAEPLAITAAGAAMAISDIPLIKPIAGVRVGMTVDGEFIVNPTVQEMLKSKLDLVLAGTSDAVLMIEGYCNFLSDEEMLQAVEIGQSAVSGMCKEIERWASEVGKPKAFDKIKKPPSELTDVVSELIGDDLERGLRLKGKKERTQMMDEAEERVLETLTEEGRNKALERLKEEEANAVWNEEDDDEEMVTVLDDEEEQVRKEKTLVALKGRVRSGGRKVEEGEGRRYGGRLYDPTDVKLATKAVASSILRRIVVNEGLRSDGRRQSDVRQISSSCGLLPRAHGSALFTRGETQAIAVVTLGGESMVQKTDGLSGSEVSRFYLQYSFPPSSVGETGRSGAPNRREIGHGMLAQRALEPILPTQEEFPYIVRLESLITESNGSSSMASVCGGCLALMDAGVPVTKLISGIAMGLILNTAECGGSGEPLILTDILGSEDALGDMDFKVAGDEDKVTAFQMDIKVEGISIPVLRTALSRARAGRQIVLKKMKECSPPPAMVASPYAPVIATMKIDPSKVVAVIGSGGKTIRGIIEDSGVDSINLEDDGSVSICARDAEGLAKAKERIHAIAMIPEVGEVYRNCPVKSVVPFGCFVEIAPGRQGLVHISELSLRRVEKVEDVVNEGDVVDVKLLEINTRGQLRLSCRALMSAQEEQADGGAADGTMRGEVQRKLPVGDRDEGGAKEGPKMNGVEGAVVRKRRVITTRKRPEGSEGQVRQGAVQGGEGGNVKPSATTPRKRSTLEKLTVEGEGNNERMEVEDMEEAGGGSVSDDADALVET